MGCTLMSVGVRAPTQTAFDYLDGRGSLDLGGMADYVENIAWLPDASALLVMRHDRNDKSCSNCVVLRPLDPVRPPVLLAPSVGGIGSFFVEPGGKSVLLGVSRDGGASIWTADFVPVKK